MPSNSANATANAMSPAISLTLTSTIVSIRRMALMRRYSLRKSTTRIGNGVSRLGESGVIRILHGVGLWAHNWGPAMNLAQNGDLPAPVSADAVLSAQTSLATASAGMYLVRCPLSPKRIPETWD